MPKKKRAQKPREQRRVRARYNRDTRNYRSPEYTKWRKEVKERDEYQCQMPGCGSRKRIQVHHIQTWAKYPGLRYTVANGITLCRKCHDSIKNKESEYEFFFKKVLEWKLLDQMREFEKRRKDGR